MGLKAVHRTLMKLSPVVNGFTKLILLVHCIISLTQFYDVRSKPYAKRVGYTIGPRFTKIL